MSLTLDPASLGPFAPDRGRMNRVVAGAAALALTAVAGAVIRCATDLVNAGTGARLATTVAVFAGLLAIAASIVGGYQATVRGETGRELARIALWVGAVAAVAGYLYGAIRDGAIRLDDFGRAYLNGDILSAIAPDLLRGLGNTLKAVVLAEALAILVGLLFATWQLSDNRLLRRVGVTYVDVVRGLPLLVLTSMIYFGAPYLGITLDPFPAVVASLAVNASAYIAEIFRAGIQAVPRGQRDAARSVGMPHGTTMLFVVIPQAFRSVIPPLMSEFIALTKDSAQVFLIVGVTAQSADLFNAARSAAASTFSPTPFMAAGLTYLIVTVPLARIVGVLERRLRAGLA